MMPIKNFWKKLVLNNRGETITEVLVAVLIMSLVAVAFSVSVVTAAKINNKADMLVTATHMDTVAGELSTDNTYTVTISLCEDGTSESEAAAGAKTEKGHAAVVVTTEKHENTRYGIDDKFYFYAIK